MTSSRRPTLPVSARASLALGALGVVFGDIGTSPLYTMRECLAHLPGSDRTEGVLGVLSLIFWALMFEVSFKYLVFITRADNRGEGGIFALLALSHTRGQAARKSGIGIATVIVLAGASLLFGDGVITPAISVLGAAEGFITFSPDFARYVVPMAVVILAALFWLQHKGTGAIGALFGPIMLVWFAALGALGLWHILDAPQVFAALNPMHGIRLLVSHPLESGAVLLGSIVLAITGSEALYADLGHFGRRAIVQAWWLVVCPGLLLNYFGQGAYALSHRTDATNPFFALAPTGPLRWALVGLSIAAAVIASQALISGTFSLVRQAVQLGYFPRLTIRHTNAQQAGQIFIPLVNRALAVGTILIVLGFRSSAGLAGAYGTAITCTMVVTTFAFFRVTQLRWKWRLWQSIGLCGAFILFDLTFFSANLHKIPEGGWFPLVIAVLILAIMHTWKTGRQEIFQRVYGNNVTEAELTNVARSQHVVRVPGAAVFMVGSPTGTPIALLHHVKANRSLHQTVVLLSAMTEEVPALPDDQRLTLTEIGEGIWRAAGRYGYMEVPDAGALMEKVRERGVPINPSSATYFFNREMIMSGGNARMWEWQKSLYAFLSRNARAAKDWFRIPPSQIIEIGLPLQL